MIPRRIAAASAIACAALGSGCPEMLGDLAATDTGDISHPATRGSPDRELLDACGRGAVTDLGREKVRRHPYVQQVTDRSASIVWTTGATGTPRVDLFRAGGPATLADTPQVDESRATPIASTAARQDVSARPLGDARQMVVPLDGLEPSTIYCYSVHHDDELLVEAAGFRTAPAVGSGKPVRFVAWGDSGDGGRRQMALLEQMHSVPFDLMLVLGDVAYEHGERAELEDNFFGVYRGLTRSLPVYPVAGNHDYATEHAAPLLEAFVLPENGAPDALERFYSFDWGDVHFVGLDTERIDATQAAWLDADLAANERPWTVVYAHKPPWSSGEHGATPAFQARFVPILDRHRVALVLAGHDHDYERIQRIGSTHYVISGGGGRETRDVAWSPLTAHAQAVIHFVYVTADADRMTLHAIDGVGREFDSLLIER
jgi:hypothetical protein